MTTSCPLIDVPKPRAIARNRCRPSSGVTSARNAVNIHAAIRTVSSGSLPRSAGRTRGRLLMTRCDQPGGGDRSTTVPGGIRSGGRAVRSYSADQSGAGGLDGQTAQAVSPSATSRPAVISRRRCRTGNPRRLGRPGALRGSVRPESRLAAARRGGNATLRAGFATGFRSKGSGGGRPVVVPEAAVTEPDQGGHVLGVPLHPPGTTSLHPQPEGL